MKTNNLKTGYLGEQIAKQYLEKKGYRIIVQNYRTKYAEIDLIARDKECLVFIEVKTKVGEQFGSPEEAINRSKIRQLCRGTAAYVIQNVGGADLRPLQYRLDAVCIVLSRAGHPERINHYKNITF